MIRLGSVVVLALALVAQAEEPEGSVWLRIVGEDLAGRRLVVQDGGIHSTAYRLGGADSASDGVWIPLKNMPQELPELSFYPPMDTPLDAQILTVPGELGDQWVIIPLPLSGWGVDSIEELEQARVSERRGRWISSSAVRRSDRRADCQSREAGRIEPSFELPLVVADFEGGLSEPLGNRYGAFEGRGASVETTRFREHGAASLRISATFPGKEGFGGVWFQLAPPEALDDEEAGIDLREAGAIVVRGRGEARGRVGVSDVAASIRGESVKLGPLRSDGSGEWTTVLPLDRRKLDLSRLRSVVIDLTGEGSGSVEIDEIVIVADGKAIPPPRRPAVSDEDLELEAGIWVWTTRDLFVPGAPQRLRLAKMIEQWDLTEVYLQIPHEGEAATIQAWGEVDEIEKVADLVEWMHGLGVEVHALDGAPYLALPEARAELMAIAAGVAVYNEQVSKESRFDALHMDIEPYLLPAWSSPRRTEVLRNLGSSIPEMREKAGVPVWLDIPFWFDSETEERSPERGERRGCARRDLLEALFRNADGVGIMAYRTTADGSGGIASAALTEARMAKEYERPFRIGIETIDLDRESGWLLRPGEKPAMRVGQPFALVARDAEAAGRYVLFTTGLTESDLEWIRENGEHFAAVTLEKDEGVSPDVITFWGRSADDVRDHSEEAIRLLRRSGARADGIAYHELRTLPLE